MADNVYFSPITAGLENRAIGTIIAAQPGSGKPVISTTQMPCYNPENETTYVKTIGEIKVGDYVYNRHGKPVEVIGVFPQGKLDAYKLTFSDGREAICGLGHLWPYIQRTREHGKHYERINCITLEKMLEKGIFYIQPNEQKDPTRKHRSRYAMPIAEATEMKAQKHKIPPYVIGAFLGNGCKNKNGSFALSSAEECVVKKVAKLLNLEDYRKGSKKIFTWFFYENCYVEGQKNHQYKIIDLDPHYVELLSNTYSGDKYIPEEYLYDSIENRWQLLQGLMDTDGTISSDEPWRHPLSYSTTSKQLAYDLRLLCNSLGLIARISTLDRRGEKRNGKGGTEYIRKSIEYEVSIRCPNCLKPRFFSGGHKFDLAQKAAKHGESNAKYDRIRLKKVEKLPQKEDMVCIMVNDPEHLFLCNDYLVTHNTFLMVNMASLALEQGAHVFCLDAKNDMLALKNIHKDIKVTDVNNIAPGSLDPFLVFENIETTAIQTIVEVLCGELDSKQKLAVSPIIKDFVRQAKTNKTTFREFANYLYQNPNEQAQMIGNQLLVHADTKYGRLIFGKEGSISRGIKIKDENRIISILGMPLPSGSQIPKPTEMVSAAIVWIICTMLTNILTRRITKRPTVVFFDECHELFRSKAIKDIIDQLLVLGRSLNVSVCMASQNVTHWDKAIAQHVSTKFCLKMSKDEALEFFSLFNNTTSENELDIQTCVEIATRLKVGHAFLIDKKSRCALIKITSLYSSEEDISSNPLLKKRN